MSWYDSDARRKRRKHFRAAATNLNVRLWEEYPHFGWDGVPDYLEDAFHAYAPLAGLVNVL